MMFINEKLFKEAEQKIKSIDENVLYADEDKELVYSFYKGAKAICKIYKALGCLEFRSNSEKEGTKPHCIEFFLTASA